jgi:ABC-type Co2+ transport system permease subunit
VNRVELRATSAYPSLAGDSSPDPSRTIHPIGIGMTLIVLACYDHAILTAFCIYNVSLAVACKRQGTLRYHAQSPSIAHPASQVTLRRRIAKMTTVDGMSGNNSSLLD